MIDIIIELLKTRSDFFINLTIQHIYLCTIVIIISLIVGVFLGVVAALNKKVAPYILGLVNIGYTIPAISMLGLLIPLSGIGNTSAIIALSIYGLLPMVKNTYAGIVNIDPKIIESAYAMGSSSKQVLFKIKLPLAKPIILTGFKSMVVMSIALAGIASFIGAGGLGVAIYRGITTNNMAMSMIGSIIIALMALLADFIISLFEKQKFKSLSLKKVLVFSSLIVASFIAINLFQPKKEVRIALKPMSEQFIIGEMLKLVIEQESDLKVSLKTVGGGSANIHPAMLNDEFDLYPEYTSSAWNYILKNQDTYPDDVLLEKIRESYQKNFDFSWISDYGFNNTYGLIIQKDVANKYNIKTYSDL
ncbi:MAG: ABC transporter permease/substrate-binding protein, partial [Bacilli bacterium]